MSDSDEQAETLDEGTVLETLREAERSPLSVGEVAARLDRSRGEVRTRLQALADAGEVARTDAEHRAWWSLPGRSTERGPSEAETGAAGEADAEDDTDGIEGDGAPADASEEVETPDDESDEPLVLEGTDPTADEGEDDTTTDAVETNSLWRGVDAPSVDDRELFVPVALVLLGALAVLALWRRRG